MRARLQVEMARGQAEALFPLLDRVVAEAGRNLAEVTALGVGVGPGNFTGTRIAVSAARGLSLALGCPAIGVSTFDMMRDPAGPGAEPAEIVSLPAPRGMAYVQHYRYGLPRSAPRLIDPSDPLQDLRLPMNMCVTGYCAAEIAARFEAEARPRVLGDIPDRLGRVTSWKWQSGIDREARPAPLYVRPPDAAPAADPPPLILS